MCRGFHLQASCGGSVSIYATEGGFMMQCHLCHSHQPCSWHQRHRLPNAKMATLRATFLWLSCHLILTKWDHTLTEKLLWVFYFKKNLISIAAVYAVFLLGVSFKIYISTSKAHTGGGGGGGGGFELLCLKHNFIVKEFILKLAWLKPLWNLAACKPGEWGYCYPCPQTNHVRLKKNAVCVNSFTIIHFLICFLALFRWWWTLWWPLCWSRSCSVYSTGARWRWRILKVSPMACCLLVFLTCQAEDPSGKCLKWDCSL